MVPQLEDDVNKLNRNIKDANSKQNVLNDGQQVGHAVNAISNVVAADPTEAAIMKAEGSSSPNRFRLATRSEGIDLQPKDSCSETLFPL